VRQATLHGLASLIADLHGDDLLIALERPPPPDDRALAIGVAGASFDGDLTSDSTRTDGYVLATDVAPTILARLGVPVPAAMSGQPIRASGGVDAAAVEALGDRMAAISARRGPVIGVSLLVWLLTLGVAAAITIGLTARFDVQLMALSVVYLPFVLLIASIVRPGEGGEQLLVMSLAPLLAFLTMLRLDGYKPLAFASGTVVLACAIDVLAGSPFTSLSLLGPNPGLGVRFYGIGNELEALLAVLVVGGTGAALSGYFPDLDRRRAALAFLAVGLLAALVFAAGRFGADVGAAIVLPVGAAAAAAKVVATPRRHATVAIITTLFVFVGFIVAIDLATGANAHLTRSVLDAGGLNDLADVAQRRLRLSAHSFSRPVLLAFMPLVLAGAGLAIWRRDLVRAWLREAPALRAGLLGALVATVAGTLANDSGALVLEVGCAYLLAFLGFAWAEGTREEGERRRAEAREERRARRIREARPPEPDGWEAERAEFERLLHQGPVVENLVFTGPPGAGRSALLASLEPCARAERWRWLPTDVSEWEEVSGEALAGRVCGRVAGDLKMSLRGIDGPPSERIVGTLAKADRWLEGHAYHSFALAFDEAQLLAAGGAPGRLGEPLGVLLDAFHAAQAEGLPCLLVLAGPPGLHEALAVARPFGAEMFREMRLPNALAGDRG
jgi:hypothetical protein